MSEEISIISKKNEYEKAKKKLDDAIREAINTGQVKETIDEAWGHALSELAAAQSLADKTLVELMSLEEETGYASRHPGIRIHDPNVKSGHFATKTEYCI